MPTAVMHTMIAVSTWSHRAHLRAATMTVAPWPHQTRLRAALRPHQTRCAALWMSLEWEDEDDEDDEDEPRVGGYEWEDTVSSLRRSYYRTEEESGPAYNAQSTLHAQRAALLGSYTSLPVVYSSSPLLPYSQTVLDVWQRPGELSTALEPYIALFEALIQTPRPWYYVQGTMLEKGRARTTGTLMRVANTKRTSDGRLQVLAQGMGRLRIVKETRSEPFPRVDAQLLVDAEALLRAESTLAGPADATSTDVGTDTASTDADSGSGAGTGGRDAAGGAGARLHRWRLAAADARELDRLCLTSALARERAWWAYDAAGFNDEDGGGVPGTLVGFNVSVGLQATRARAEADAVQRVVEAKGAWSSAGAAVAAADNEYTWGGAQDFFMEIEAAESAEVAAEQERCARVATLEERSAKLEEAVAGLREIGIARAEELELACWVELDALLRRHAALNAARPPEEQRETPRLRAELLGLLPHEMPPSLGAAAAWPDEFNLLRMLDLLDGERQMRVDPAYPAERRSARLSYALADVLSQVADSESVGGALGERTPGSQPIAALLQEVLEAPSTSDRLRLVLRRLQTARLRLSLS